MIKVNSKQVTVEDKLNPGIENASFVSVWDDGIEIASECKVDMNTKEVFDIQQISEGIEMLEILKKEFIRFDNRKEYPVCHADERTEKGFWYQ